MLKNFLKVTFRNIARHKGFSFLNIAGLSLGLTTCLLIGLFVWDEQAYDRHVPEADRIYRLVVDRQTPEGSEVIAMVPPMFATSLRQQFAEVEGTTRVFRIYDKNLLEYKDKKIYQGGLVLAEANYFQFFPAAFKFGSPKGALSDPRSILLSEEVATRIFGSDNPVGQDVSVDKTLYTVKGVYRPDTKFHLQPQFILPMQVLLNEIEPKRMESWGWQQFYTYMKAKPGVDVAALHQKFAGLVQREGQASDPEEKYGLTPRFQPLEEVHLHSSGFKHDMAVRGNHTYVRALTIIAVFVLLIACFNFVNLATAKSLQRAREVGVRKTIGASRGQLMVQFIAETVMMTLISILVSIGLTFLLLPWLNGFTGKSMSFPLFSNPMLALLLVGLTLAVGLLAGFYPSLVLSGFQPIKVLKGSGTGAENGRQTPWLRHALVVIQFSISVLLIISALVVYRQVNYLHGKDLGFNKEGIMFFGLRGQKMNQNQEAFKNELQKLPGVSSVCVGYGFPGDATAGDGIIVPRNGERKPYSSQQLLVDHDYVKTLGLTIVAGRDFSKDIATDEPHGFLINETAVKELGFGTPEKAIGQPLEWEVWESQQPDSIKYGKIIGVVRNFHFKSLYDRLETTVIQIYPPAYSKVAVKFNTAALDQTIAQVNNVWSRFSPEYPLEYIFLDENFQKMYEAEDKLKSLLWVFTGIAVVVGCLGLFGLAAYAAERRKKEIGIRKVLGASVQGVVALLSKDFVKLVLVSLLIASPLAWYFMHQWLDDFAYRVDIGWWVFAAAGVLAVLIALLTVSYQAVRAALGNPVRSLRNE